jgi:NAD(P)-dependent dehydrogenase (short-subunit alcohol dehydrogenase family)
VHNRKPQTYFSLQGHENLVRLIAVPEEMKQEAIDAVPMKRLGRPEESAKAILFLASADASYITSSELAVDGGTTQL